VTGIFCRSTALGIPVKGVVACGLPFCGTNPGYQPYDLVHAVRAACIRFFIVEPELLQDVLVAAQEVGLAHDRILMFDNLPGQARLCLTVSGAGELSSTMVLADSSAVVSDLDSHLQSKH